ncbi:MULTISPECIES: hypothetical protein [Halomonadaceae]|nr:MULTISPECIES: hypothetical protein [Halomonas]
MAAQPPRKAGGSNPAPLRVALAGALTLTPRYKINAHRSAV